MKVRERAPVHAALIVEDDPSWQQLLTEMLTDLGLQVDVAGDPDHALRLIRERPHHIAIIDLSLQPLDAHNRDGLHIMTALRRHDPGCTALLLTGYATVEVAVQALTEYHAFTVLRKETFSRREFRDVVRRALAQAPPVSDTERVDRVPVGKDRAPSSSRGLVLIVEDDAGWQNILSELVSEQGLLPTVSRSYAEALGLLRRKRFILAVVDLSLASSLSPTGNRDGWRLLTTTRDLGILTIVVSGMGTPEDAEVAYRDLGIFAYVEKQAFDRRAFLRLLDDAVQATRAPHPILASLTPREREVLELLAQGMTNKEIADALVISPNTVKRHLQAVFQKLNVTTRAAAVARYRDLQS